MSIGTLEGERHVATNRPRGGGLRPRETEIVRRLAEGQTFRQIGDSLQIKERTVRFHTENAKEAMQAVNLLNLIAISIRRGLIGQ